MKTCVLFMALLCLIIYPAPAKIKNGYSVDIDGAQTSLERLTSLLQFDGTLSIFQRMSIRNKMTALKQFISYRDFTETMLDQFKLISPQLYYQIDTLKDAQGRTVDVYVKFVSEENMPPGVAATTNLKQDLIDKDAYASEYGIQTVSVRIAKGKNCLALLAHEFGHVEYQVANLRNYLNYYSTIYLSNNYDRKSIGHSDKDPSGKSASGYSRRFKECYVVFLKLRRAKLEPHLAVLQKIRNRSKGSPAARQ